MAAKSNDCIKLILKLNFGQLFYAIYGNKKVFEKNSDEYSVLYSQSGENQFLEIFRGLSLWTKYLNSAIFLI